MAREFVGWKPSSPPAPERLRQHAPDRPYFEADSKFGGLALQDLNLRYLYEAAKLGSMRAAADSLGRRGIVGEPPDLPARSGNRSRPDRARPAQHQAHRERRVADRALFGPAAPQRSVRGQAVGHQGACARAASSSPSARGSSASRSPTCWCDSTPSIPDCSSTCTCRLRRTRWCSLVCGDDAHLGLVFQSSDDPRIRVSGLGAPAALRDHEVRAPARDTQAPEIGRSEGGSAVPARILVRDPPAAPDRGDRGRLSLQPGITANSITLLKSLLRQSEFYTVLPVLAVSEEVKNGQFAAVPIDSAALQEASVQLIGRLGRRLPPAPLRMVSALTTYLESCGGRIDSADILVGALEPGALPASTRAQIAANANQFGAHVIDRAVSFPQHAAYMSNRRARNPRRWRGPRPPSSCMT